MDIQTGDILENKYELIQDLGAGGFGRVFHAQHLVTKQVYAIKVLIYGDEYDIRKIRFLQEIKILSNLDHPNIVKVLDKAQCLSSMDLLEGEDTNLWNIVKSLKEDEPLWYAMELLQGRCLKHYLKARIPLYQKLEWFKQITSGVAHMHEKGYVHRDIKPDNIMMRSSTREEPVLFDLGLVHNPNQFLTLGNPALGTMSYFSPEQMEGKYEFKQIDVWALGVILYQFLTGVHPLMETGEFTQSSIQLIFAALRDGTIIDPGKIIPDLDEYIRHVCMKALEKNMHQRYRDARALETGLLVWRNENQKRSCQKAQAAQERGSWEEAIRLWEEAFAWYPKEEIKATLQMLWEKIFPKETIALLPLHSWEEQQKEAGPDKEIITLRYRRVGNKNLSAERHDYLVCKRTDRKHSGINQKIFALLACLESQREQSKDPKSFAVGTEAILALTLALKDDLWHVRCDAACALGKLGAKAKEAIPALLLAVRDPHGAVRQEAANALAKMGEASIPHLTRALEDEDWMIRQMAAEILGAIGLEAQEAVSALLNRMEDPTKVVRWAAEGALAKIIPESMERLLSLRAHLKERDPELRLKAVRGLEELGTLCLPFLLIALKDADSSVRQAATEALGKMGPAANASVSYLKDALYDSEPYVRQKAAWALGKIGPLAKDAVPSLSDALKNSYSPVRRNAAAVLGKIGHLAKDAVPHLIMALKDQDAEVRKNSAWALGKIGSAAKDAFAFLQQALDDKDLKVQQAADLALKQIQTSDI